MRPMVRLTLGLVALIAIMVGVAFGLPSHGIVKRDIVINAPAFGNPATVRCKT